MKQERKNILWLTSWFPNRTEPLAGDFIERHGRAASLLNNIHTLFVVKDHRRATPGNVFIERREYKEGAKATILYYKVNTGWSLLDSVVSGLKYIYYFRKLIKEYISVNGTPDMINVHISYKAGIAALYCKWFLGIKYIVSEQWTIFCKEARPGFKERSFLIQLLIKLIYKNAWRVSTVSEYLGNALVERFGISHPVRIPNVVDTGVFFPSAKTEKFRFIHISLLNYQKNPDDIFKAVKKLTELSPESFEFVIYGPLKENLIQRVKQLNLEDIIQFKGEVGHDILSEQLRKSHALILYSRYETFGCVIIEAYASGVPVIVSDIPVMQEIVDENTGIFAAPENPEALAEKMLWMMNNQHLFDSGYLATVAAGKYGFATVAASFDDLYRTT
jgi:glycosyltransferase involved in cell wall biosynthesis